METILAEIDECMAGGRWYAAIALSLTLPDICATLAAPDDARRDGVKARYKAWCRKHLADEIVGLDPDICWELRSGIIHTGAFKHQDFERVAISLPEGASVHNLQVVIDGTRILCLNAETLCRTIHEAARQWFDENKDKPLVQANLPKLVRRQEGALMPFLKGPVTFVSDLK